MTNTNLFIDGGLEFSKLPHKTPYYASSSLDVRILEVGIEYPNKDVFLTVLKRYNCKQYKFEGMCIMHDERCKWNIMSTFWKKTGLWRIKKYFSLHTCVVASARYDPPIF
ncbi:hypothetical protein J1N35_038846 [Gossypium stocksii]|uniref:Transposase MuDR plant domain-containing protein n=1 Tax=Gossypium stocksii TaxID=47602 RepID=A0A9D3ZN69_9ROSI|nr:hypothetical protein J1N35_038846 [Gossypium stocksii]